MNPEIEQQLLVILSQRHTEGKLISYAQTYAKAAFDLNMDGYMLRVQLSYVMSNLSGWRGPIAVRVKHKLKKLQQQLS